MPTRRDTLDALYARLPALECRGKCQHSCAASVDMSDVERARILAEASLRMPSRDEAPGACIALTMLGACVVYPVRPMICRLWGVTDAMRCPHGCRPAGGYLADRDALNLLLDAFEVGGGGYSPAAIAEIRRLLDVPELLPLLSRLMRGDSGAYTALVDWFRHHPDRGW